MGRGFVNIALLGAGQIGRYHADTIARHLRDARLAAVADPLATNAREAASLSDNVVVADTAADILRDDGIDAVVIATPTRFHAPLIVEAARAGKHIFCEKPIALTAEDGAQALAAAASSGVKLQVGFQRRFDAGYLRAKEAIAGGEVGAVELLSSTTRDPQPPVPGYLEGCGGVFLDTAIHDYDSVRFLSGSEVSEVFATASTLITKDRNGPFDIDTFVTVLRLESGALASVTNSLRAAYGYEAGAEVFGSKGKIVIAPYGGGVRRFDAGGVVATYPQTYLERFGAAYRAELADFVRCIIDDDLPAVTGDDGVRALEIALAATRSQLEGHPVRI
jgi:myo-inositol 2-dehydrogenase / D-chiro-inositol 1-dehydrogenase